MDSGELTKGILTKEQQAFGLAITDSEDFVHIWYNGERVRTFNALTVTIGDLRFEADQIIEQAKAITVERV